MTSVITRAGATAGGIETTMQRLRDEVDSTRSLADLAQACPDGLARLTLQGRFTEVTAAVERMTGWRPEVLHGRALPSLAHPDDRTGIEERLARLIAGADRDGEPTERITFRARRVDARYAWMEATVRVERDAVGATAGLVAALRDVDERHAASLAERRRTSEFAALARIGRAVAAGATGDALDAALVAELVEALGARAVLAHGLPRADGAPAPCTAAGWSDAAPEVPAPGLDEPSGSDGCVARAIASGEACTVAFGDCTSDHGRGLALMWGHGASVPVIADGRVVGALTAVYAREDMRPGHEVTRVLALAAELSGLTAARS